MKHTIRGTFFLLCALFVALTVNLQASAIGLNFSVTGDDTTALSPDDVAGASDVKQSHWNNLGNANGSATKVTDDTGNTVPSCTVNWSVPPGDTAWRSKTLSSWGFEGANLKLQLGTIQVGGTLQVTNVPYEKYDVYVYLNAGESGGTGSVILTSDKLAVEFYKLGWLDGKFVEAGGTDADSARSGNFVVFRGVTAKQFSLDWKGDIAGGWTGVSGVQIIGR